MIDLHSHLLPGIDDGAPNVETSLALAEIALADGITHMVCTPHIHPGRYDNSVQTIQQALDQFKSALKQRQLPLQVSAAAEVRFGMEILDGIAQGRVPFLGQWKGESVMLLEFPHGELPFGAEKLIKWLRKHQVIPMIAHPERNKMIMKQPERLKPFLEMGCLLQVTASAVAGGFGEVAQTIATQLLKENKVTILATDAHNIQHRPPQLTPGLQVAKSIVGDQAAMMLVKDNPWQLAESKFIS